MAKNEHGDRTYQTYDGWKRAIKKAGATWFSGDKDINEGFDKHVNEGGRSLGEWDGETGFVFSAEYLKAADTPVDPKFIESFQGPPCGPQNTTMRFYTDKSETTVADLPQPTDITKWWMRPHCGPGSLDPEGQCGFCGESHQQCATNCTQKLKAGEPMRDFCGGSGFWCTECSRFWPQNGCGECFDPSDFVACDEKELTTVDGYVTCTCGHKIATEAKFILVPEE